MGSDRFDRYRYRLGSALISIMGHVGASLEGLDSGRVRLRLSDGMGDRKA